MIEIALLDRFVTFCGEHEWIGSRSLVFLTPAFNNAFDDLSLQYLVLLLAGYPLAVIFAKLPSPTLKHAYSCLVGLWMMQNIFLSQWIHSFISAMVTYILVLALPNKIMPKVVFAFLLSYICGSHIYRMYVDYMGWSLDFTGPQMLLTIKLSAFAYNVADGRIYEKLTASTGNERKDKVNKQRAKVALREVPGPLEYMGYTYCFATILAGPAFEYKEYIATITGERFRSVSTSNGNGGDANSSTASYTIPPRALPVLSKLATGLLCVVVHQVGGATYPIDRMVAPETLAMPPLQRYGLMWICLLCCRMKYYFAWKVADGAAVLCGFGYEGTDDNGKPKWNGVNNMDIIDFETAENMTGNSRAWNKMTQSWLEKYVYTRTNNSLMATYFVSAFWHGFYPGYYLFFMSLPLAQQTLRVARKSISPHFYKNKTVEQVYHYTCIIINSMFINYLVIPFQMLSWERSTAVWGSFHYFPHIAIAVLYILGRFVLKPPMPAKGENGAATMKKEL
ncbi:MBOAT, membrane-bound O-acyltransferase family-domain-containing protein [Tribonema minus]|uniref:MBOAT, membrane-bound O-acyltransferase family-domain-containing protein n=1 Tax=Tribonema minus TaxID=303371 RepID=A0A835Z8U4_9STRA|nr:MBOAT, membrane-bound O-acyltransferase family-domain-containing protein [Tribonema minus]